MLENTGVVACYELHANSKAMFKKGAKEMIMFCWLLVYQAVWCVIMTWICAFKLFI